MFRRFVRVAVSASLIAGTMTAIVATGGSRASASGTGPIIVGNTAAYGGGPIQSYDFSAGGAPTASFVPSGATGSNNGRGLVVIGSEVYYTELSNRFGATPSIEVAPYNGGAGGADTRTLPNPRPGFGIQDLKTFGGALYVLTGYSTNPLEVFKLNPFSGAVLGGPISIASPAAPDSDGFTILPNGNFLINSGDANCTYNQYNSSTGALINGTTISVPGGTSCTGVDTDGTYLYFQTNWSGFTQTDLSGNVVSTKSVSSNLLEDISVVHSPAGVTPQGSAPGADLTGGGSPSEPGCNCTGGDPVQLATGDYVEKATDLTVPGTGLPLRFTRTYDAVAASTGLGSKAPSGTAPDIGPGWFDNLDMHVSTTGWGTPNQADTYVQPFDPGSVSCGSTTLCWTASGQEWTGSSWTAPSTIDANGVDTVDCPSASLCFAGDSNHEVAEWNGTSWSSPVALGSVITGQAVVSISCPSTSLCWALTTDSYAYEWNGTSWSAGTHLTPTLDPNDHPASAPTPYEVSCPTTSFCMAVFTDSDAYSYAMSWNGTSWSASTTIEFGTGQVDTVTCPSSSLCWAADYSGQALSWNGTSWSTPRAIVPSGRSLYSIACPSITLCWAIGPNSTATEWNGTSWSTLVTIDGTASLTSISCPSTSLCWVTDNSGDAIPWNGTSWSSATGELIDSAVKTAQLSSVSCPTLTLCWAVDWQGQALQWNGASWAAPLAVDSNQLNAVSCPSVSLCWAVDGQGGAVKWNGTSWGSVVQADNLYNGLYSISCPSVSLCWAADGSGYTVQWNGTAWGSPVLIDPNHDSLFSVSCASVSLCWAIDADYGDAMEWNGTAWGSPVLIDPNSHLYAISCSSVSLCWAVDNSGKAIEWNGSSWNAPLTIDAGGQLLSISCPSASLCWAGESSGEALSWNGTSWSAPVRVSGNAALEGVACASVALCWAVGSGGQVAEWSPSATVTEEDGAQVTFQYHAQGDPEAAWCPSDASSGVYCPTAPRVLAQLVQNGDGSWTFTRRGASPLTFSFNGSGVLTSMSDQVGDTITSAPYTGAACPTGDTCTSWSESSAADTLIVAEANVNGSPLIQKVFELNSGLTATFSNSRTSCSSGSLNTPELCSVTDPGNLTTAYGYNGSYQMTSMTPPTGGVVTNTYAGSQVATQCITPSSGLPELTGFSYSADGTLLGGSDTTLTSYPNGAGNGCSVSGTPATDTSVYKFSNDVLVELDKSPGTSAATATKYIIDPTTLLPTSETDGNSNTTSQQLNNYSQSGSEFTSADPTLKTDGAGNQSQYAYTSHNLVWCQVSPAEYLNGVRCPTSPPGSPPAPGASDPNLGMTISFYNGSDEVTARTDSLGNTTMDSYTSGVTGVPNGLVYCSVDPVDYQKSVSCPAYGAAHVTGTQTKTFDGSGKVLTSIDADGNTTSFCFYYQTSGCAASAPSGGSGGNPQQLYSTTSPDGTTTAYTYDAAGHALTKVQSYRSYQATTINAYTSGGLLYCTIAPLAYSQGHTTCPSTPPSSPPAPGAAPWPGATVTIYDNTGRMLDTVSPLGGVTQNAYDGSGEQYCSVTATAYAQGVTCPSSPPSSPPTVGNDPYLGATITSYDSDGRVSQVTNPLGGITQNVYDGAGNVTQATVESNNSTSAPNVVTGYIYDADNRVKSTTVDPNSSLSSTTASFYDPNGNTFCSVSANAEAQGSSAFQCPAWQATWISAPPSPSSLYSSTPNSAQANNVTTTFFNDNGDQAQTTDADVHTNINALDGDGRAYCTADPTNVSSWLTSHPTGTYPYLCPPTPPSSPPSQGSNPGYLTSIFDAAGHMLSKTDQIGDTTTHTYDPSGHALTTTDPRGKVTTDCYYYQNGTGQCANAAPASGGSADDLYSTTTPATSADPNGQLSTSTYFPGGAANVATSPAGTSTAAYDPAGDPTSVSYSNTASGYSTPANLSYTYNADRSRHTMVDATGTTTYGYDNAGDLTSQSLTAATGSGLSNTTTSYTYFSTGTLASIVYPSYSGHTNPTVTYNYDGTGAMSGETDWLGNQVTFAHDQDGNQTAQDNNVSTTNPSGTSSTGFSYDPADLNTGTTSTLAQTCGGNETFTQSFAGAGGSRNPDGQLTQYQTSYSGSCSGQTGTQRNYTYDIAGRVVYQGSTTQGANANNFAYDPSGDVTTISSHDTSGNFDTYTQTFDNAGETLGQTPISGSHGSASTYSYDTLGDQTSTTTGSATTSYGFDQAAHMVNFNPPSGAVSSYLYDGNGLQAATKLTQPAWGTPTTIDSTRSIKSVSCPTSSFCAAVDASGYATTYNGASWSAPSDIDGTHAIEAVSCASSSFCEAVDNAGNALTYNGSSWSSASSIDSTRVINGLSCPSASFCAAVDASGYATTFNGTSWSSPSRIDNHRALDAVSCTSSSFCKAVDNAGNTLTYNGSAWSSATSIDSTRVINSVSCPTSSFCAAVDASGYATTYNGTPWSTPADIDGTHALDAVSCPSSTFCKAVDNTGNALTYNGTSWSSASSVDSTRVINGTTCATTTYCVAVDSSGYGITFQNATTVTGQLTWMTSTSLPLILSDGTNHYVYGPNATPVEQVSLSNSTNTYLTYTGSNSTWISSNQAGDQTGNWTYDAYGTLSFGTPTSPFGYSGQYTDNTTGFINDRARWYGPQVGAFTSRDPAFASSDTAYTYANGDPINQVDPTGLWVAEGTISRGFTPTQAELFVASLYPNHDFQLQLLAVPGGKRVIDVYSRPLRWLNEVKTGTQNLPPLQSQIDKDVQLMATGGGRVLNRNDDRNAWKPVAGDTWWFLPNAHHHVTNPSWPLINELDSRGINVIILYYNKYSDDSVFCKRYGIDADQANDQPLSDTLDQQYNSTHSFFNHLGVDLFGNQTTPKTPADGGWLPLPFPDPVPVDV